MAPSISITLNEYLNKINNALYEQHGILLGELMSCQDMHVLSSRLLVDHSENVVNQMVAPPVNEIVSYHLRVVGSISRGNSVEAWQSQTQVVNLVARFLTDCKEENWMLPLMYKTCLDLRLFASAADKELSRLGKGKPGETLEKASETLMACFRVCAADARANDQVTKKWGLLYLVNQFFKIYFKINKLNLCKPMIRAVEQTAFKEDYPLSQQITYKYYTGRKAMFDSDFKTAAELLTFAFEHCPRSCWKNKRRILIYLIPVRMLLGFMPKLFLLKKYNLPEFNDVVIGARQGNIRLLSESLCRYESFFIGAGIYLILEKLKLVAYRNLFKRVFQISDTHQLDISRFLQALLWLGENEMDLDEAECLLANMIYDGKVKGYISHAHRKIVISKKDPFPPLAMC